MIRWHRLTWWIIDVVVFVGLGTAILSTHQSAWWLVLVAFTAAFIASDIAPSKREGSK